MYNGVSVKLGRPVHVIGLSHLSEISFLIFLYWIVLISPMLRGGYETLDQWVGGAVWWAQP